MSGTRWDIYGDPHLDELLAKAEGAPWDALRKLIGRLEWQADTLGRGLPYPWHESLRRAHVRDEHTVYGVVEYTLESREHRIARILDITWLPDVTL